MKFHTQLFFLFFLIHIYVLLLQWLTMVNSVGETDLAACKGSDVTLARVLRRLEFWPV